MESLIILIGRALIELVCITIFSRLGKIWLYGSILINLVLVSVLGAKTIIIGGIVTNTGNVFYASIIYAIYLLIEHHNKESAIQSIWFGTTFIIFFMLMNQFVVGTLGTPATRIIDDAMRTVLSSIPRVSIASLIAFIPSQYINIYLYSYLKRVGSDKSLWLRNIVSLIVTGIIDSVIFFSIAFLGILPLETMIWAAIIGFAIKVFVGILSTPFLYFSLSLQKE